MRDTIFIGHATPEDNEFAVWLYSRLETDGYKVWCDQIGLPGGERDFWEVIQDKIKNDACKYLLVFSQFTFEKRKNGVKDEYEFARSVAKNNNLEDFVIPLKIDNIVSFDARIGINRYNIIDFIDWGKGLERLFEKLEKDHIPKNVTNNVSISNIIFNRRQTELIKKPEIYFSNWWPIEALPEKIHCFQYPHERFAKMLIEEGADYPIIRHGNFLISFERNHSCPK